MSEYNTVSQISVTSADTLNQIKKSANVAQNDQYQEIQKQVSPYNASEEQTANTQKQSLLGNNNNVHLKFQVDNETNDITVLVLDKASKQVIRTIPPEELANLRAGDLFDLFM